jgi:probable HAF family extracellular repeat protein
MNDMGPDRSTQPRVWCAAHHRLFAHTAAAIGTAFATIIVIILLCAAHAGAQNSYTAIELTAVPQGSSRAVRGVNDAGDVVGGGRTGGGLKGFVIRGAGPDVVAGLAGGDYGIALGINDLGEIVGAANTGTAMRAFRSTAGSSIDLGTLPGDTASQAFAINRSGQAVGLSSGPTGIRAVIWERDDTIRALPPVPGSSSTRALAINDAGDAAGIAMTAAGPRAVAWAGTAAKDLGTLPGHRSSEAVSINNRGEIVGSSEDPNSNRRAVFWAPGASARDLGSLSPGSFTRALGINDGGEVVGSSETSAGARAFIWTPQAGIRDLNDLVTIRAGFVLTEAVAISPRGVILALGEDTTGEDPSHGHDHRESVLHVFVLQPAP